MQTSSTGVSRTRQVVAAVIGNALEWYDFIVYGFLASIIARQFFPSDDEYASLLMALATFGVGFFMRPVGGVLLGMYSDRKGRKAAMQMIIRLMTVSIAMIAFAPDYLAIGMAAPLLIVVAHAARVCHRWRVRQRHGVSGGECACTPQGPVWLVAIGRAVPGGVFRGGDGGTGYPPVLA